jgi:hypothetical protein
MSALGKSPSDFSGSLFPPRLDPVMLQYLVSHGRFTTKSQQVLKSLKAVHQNTKTVGCRIPFKTQLEEQRESFEKERKSDSKAEEVIETMRRRCHERTDEGCAEKSAAVCKIAELVKRMPKTHFTYLHNHDDSEYTRYDRGEWTHSEDTVLRLELGSDEHGGDQRAVIQSVRVDLPPSNNFLQDLSANLEFLEENMDRTSQLFGARFAVNSGDVSAKSSDSKFEWKPAPVDFDLDFDKETQLCEFVASAKKLSSVLIAFFVL